MTGIGSPEGDQSSVPLSVGVQGTELPVWPPDQDIQMHGVAKMAATKFVDHAGYHSPLIEATLAAECDPRFHDPKHLVLRAGCGNKVRDIQDWNVPAATLVHARALMLAHRMLERQAVFADDDWASVYRNGDYCMPHGHPRSYVSIVYMLDPGDPNPVDEHAGRLYFADPRIDWCCPLDRGRPTRPLLPAMTPGTMLIFSSEYLHGVNPYLGSRPRITLSWNITRKRLPGRPRAWAG